jgi:cytochrome c-type biogenesis protein CcmH/NrfG
MTATTDGPGADDANTTLPELTADSPQPTLLHATPLVYALDCGELMLRTHHPEQALRYFETAIHKDPNCAIAWVGRGRALMLLEYYDDAIASFHHALVRDGQCLAAWHGLGRVFDYLGHFAAALSAFDGALRVQPGDRRVQHSRKQTLRRLRQQNARTRRTLRN